MGREGDGGNGNDTDGAAHRPVTLITGCSRGIGLALAEHLASTHKHTVVATLRDVSAAPSSLRAAGCDVHTLDVTSDASVAALASHLRAAYGGVDVVVNNAGYGVPGSCESIPVAQQQQLFNTNVWGVVRLAQTLLPVLRERGGGVFLAVSSTSGVRSVPGNDAYAASKRAVEAILEGLRYSVRRDGVRIAVVNPGPVQTDFLSRYRAEGAAADTGMGLDCDGAQMRSGAGRERVMWADRLGARMASSQSCQDCACAIASVVCREWNAVCRGDRSLATFWNGTDEASQKVVESVRKVPDGTSGPYAALLAEAEQRLDAAAAAAAGNMAESCRD